MSPLILQWECVKREKNLLWERKRDWHQGNEEVKQIVCLYRFMFALMQTLGCLLNSRKLSLHSKSLRWDIVLLLSHFASLLLRDGYLKCKTCIYFAATQSRPGVGLEVSNRYKGSSAPYLLHYWFHGSVTSHQMGTDNNGITRGAPCCCDHSLTTLGWWQSVHEWQAGCGQRERHRENSTSPGSHILAVFWCVWLQQLENIIFWTSWWQNLEKQWLLRWAFDIGSTFRTM